MTLLEFKELVEKTQNEVLKYGISEPFSWRGSYDEVAFEVIKEETKKEDVLANIKKAYEGTFYGYKGGEYKYEDYTDVNFEYDTSSYTNGGYCANIIAEIEDTIPYKSEEHRLATLAFS